MDIFNIGGNELLVILILAGIVLGPERLARVARTLGKLVRDVRNYFNALSDELKSELEVLDEVKDIKDEISGKL
jgi:sec-independent protein translocase protein TatB